MKTENDLAKKAEELMLKEYSEWYRRDVIGGNRLEAIFSFFSVVLPWIILPICLCFYLTFWQKPLKDKALETFKIEYFKENSVINKKIVLLGMRPSVYKQEHFTALKRD